MFQILLRSSLIALAAVFMNCSENTTTSPPNVRVDTTSHNFVWQVDTLGPISSTLNDIAFISDNEVWAFGRIPIQDSTSSLNKGFAKWSAGQWRFEDIEYETGQNILGNGALRVQDTNDIWVSVGSIFQWSGGPYDPISWLRDISTPEIAVGVWGNGVDRIIFT